MKVEMESQAILKFSVDSGKEGATTSARKRLLRHLPPSYSQQIRGLTLPQCSFLLAVYYLEALRVRSGEFRALFSYLGDVALTDQRASNIGFIAAAFRGIADETFAELINYLNARKFTESSRSEKLAAICEFLLVHYASNVDAVRNAADVYITQFVGNFPQVLWHRRCLHVLLELLDIVARARSMGPLDKTHREVPGTEFFVDLPEDAASTAHLYSSVVGLCNNWLREAIRMAPAETFAVLHAYMKRFSESAQQLAKSHYGVSLAAEVLSVTSAVPVAGAAVGSPPAAAILQRDNTSASMFVTALASKARFGGEVEGMVQLLDSQMQSGTAALRLASVLLERFDKLSSEGDAANLAAYVGTMYQASAFLARQGNPVCCAELLSRIVWVPVRIFTRDSLDVATSAWSWLLAASPQLADSLMAQVWLAWSWTIEARMGLFSDAARPESPLAIKRDSAGTTGSAVQRKCDCGPHRVWLSFLAERLVVAENAENGHINILFKILYKSCADPRKLSVLSQSFGTRFHMLLLALKLAHVLRERRVHQLHQ
jgi:phosphatidylinositol 4-kinase